MNNKATKIAAIILSVILLAGALFCVCWTFINFDKVTKAMSGTALYTAEDLQAAYDDGYNDANFDKSTYDGLISSYRAKIDELENSLAPLQAQYDKLNGLYNELITAYDNLSEDYTAAVAEIEALTAEINNTVAYYELLLQEYSRNDDEFIVTFYVNGSIYSVKTVQSGSYVSVEDPNIDGYDFICWTVDGEEIDLQTYSITHDVKIYADTVQVKYYAVTFYIDSPYGNTALNIPFNTEYAVQKVAEGQTAVNLSVDLTNYYGENADKLTFNGWKSADGDLIDLNTYTISQDLDLYADISGFLSLRLFEFSDNTDYDYAIYNVVYGDYITVPSADELGFDMEGYSFLFWLNLHGDGDQPIYAGQTLNFTDYIEAEVERPEDLCFRTVNGNYVIEFDMYLEYIDN